MSRDAKARRARQSRKEQNQEFFEAVRDLMNHPVVQRMKNYPHHCDTTCYQHCVNVAYYNYRICKALGLNARAAASAEIARRLMFTPPELLW